MSGVAYQIPLSAVPGSPMDGLRKMADLYQARAQEGLTVGQAKQSQAQAGLIGQQEEAARIANAIQAVRIGALAEGAGVQMPYRPGANAPGAVPPGIAGAGSAPQPVERTPAAASPAASMGTAIDGGGGDAPGGISAIGQPQGQQQPRPVTPYGAVVGPNGLAVPGWQMTLALTQPDPTKAQNELLGLRSRLLMQTIAQTTNPGEWDQAVSNLYQQGWLSTNDYKNHIGQFRKKGAVLQSLADANNLLQADTALAGHGMMRGADGSYVPSPGAIAARGGIAGAEAQARVQPSIDTAVGTARGTLPFNVAQSQAQPYSIAPGDTRITPPNPGGPVRLADATDPTRPMEFSEWGRIQQGTEGGFGTGPRPNASGPGGTPTSTAAGGQQFTAGTWLEQVKAQRPDIARGRSDQALLALRSDDALSSEIAGGYARNNAPTLWNNGIRATGTTLAMAHRFGAEGAVAAMTAPPNTPLSRILSPEALAANPTWGRMTNSQMFRRLNADYGDRQLGDIPLMSPGAGGAAPAPGAQAPAPVAQGVAVRPGAMREDGQPDQAVNERMSVAFGGGPRAPGPEARLAQPMAGGGTQVIATRTPFQLAQEQNTAKQIQEYQDDWLAKAENAKKSNAVIDQARIASQSWTGGPTREIRAAMERSVNEIGQVTNSLIGRQVFQPIKAVGDYEAFQKAIIENVRQVVMETSNRAAVKEFQILQDAQPSGKMSPTGLRTVFNFMQGYNDWVQAKATSSANVQSQPNRFNGDFDKAVSPVAFMINRMSNEDFRAMAPAMTRTAEGRQMLSNVMKQMEWMKANGILTADNAGVPAGRQY